MFVASVLRPVQGLPQVLKDGAPDFTMVVPGTQIRKSEAGTRVFVPGQGFAMPAHLGRGAPLDLRADADLTKALIEGLEETAVPRNRSNWSRASTGRRCALPTRRPTCRCSCRWPGGHIRRAELETLELEAAGGFLAAVAELAFQPVESLDVALTGTPVRGTAFNPTVAIPIAAPDGPLREDQTYSIDAVPADGTLFNRPEPGIRITVAVGDRLTAAPRQGLFFTADPGRAAGGAWRRACQNR